MSDQRWSNAILDGTPYGQYYGGVILEREWLCITFAYAGLDGLKACINNELTVWQLRRPDDLNDVAPTSFVNVWPKILPIKCQRWPNEWL